MTDERKQEIELTIATLKELWLKYPELRLCQLLENSLCKIINTDYEHNNHCIFYITDEKLRKAMKEFDKCLEKAQ